ncbi:peptidylprolyl isomerase [Thalassococcus sp. S3]|uniref:peptidylprolyl isomerase n=1 Tax=Thalassococcus sp. S3 TaxID=2017482 RepID=UPI0010248B89|nr:peptidylprolyl isomerase [Thalassococcus sp. S3]QBF31624.1 peptidylprolyl isomerase [Thalassococcus sp. S3]
MQQYLMRLILACAAALTLQLTGGGAMAQGLFSPAITVNEDAVTFYELEQRERFLRLLRAPGNPSELARQALIEDQLKRQVTREADIVPTEQEVLEGMDEFAARANLSREEFIQGLAGGGVSEETFRDFVEIGIAWREFVRARFLSRARPSESEIDRALGSGGGGGGVRVLLSEIIMPVNPNNIDTVQARAERISQLTSTSAFSAEARRYSATATRGNGGRMNWLPITDLPAQLRPVILALAPGEVTSPLSLPNAIALFQLRDIEETDAAAPTYSAIEYAAYYIPGGRSEAALNTAASIRARVDTCDDLYGIAQGQPEEVLDRGSLPPSEIPQDIAVELAKLDDGEVSTALTRSNGQTLVFLMLCGRTAEINQDTSRTDAANALTQQRLNFFSQSYLEQLRADAVIVEQ